MTTQTPAPMSSLAKWLVPTVPNRWISHGRNRIHWLNDLTNWYKTWYAPNNATLVIVGDVNPTDAINEVKKYFADKTCKPCQSAPVIQPGFRGYQENHAIAGASAYGHDGV